MSHMAPRAGDGPIPARTHDRATAAANTPDGLFPNVHEAKKRKFILVDDNVKASRLRVRVTLEGVDTNEIPDSFRRDASVFPRSHFPREMQSPPPTATGSHFFADDASDDGIQQTEGRDPSRRRSSATAGSKLSEVVEVMSSGHARVPRTSKAFRSKEVKLNDLAHRMAWLQSRVFDGRPIFLQRSRKFYP